MENNREETYEITNDLYARLVEHFDSSSFIASLRKSSKSRTTSAKPKSFNFSNVSGNLSASSSAVAPLTFAST